MSARTQARLAASDAKREAEFELDLAKNELSATALVIARDAVDGLPITEEQKARFHELEAAYDRARRDRAAAGDAFYKAYFGGDA